VDIHPVLASDTHRSVTDARRYELTIRGQLDPSWSDWFDSADVRATVDGCTVLTQLVADQAALHGLLAQIRDLGVELLSLRVVDRS
jgi:hypothetical protein